MQVKRRLLMELVLVVWLSCAVSLATAPEGRAQPCSQQKAERILNATGVKGGLIVHIGCGNGELTAALRAGDRYLVHGLDVKAKSIEQAREHIRSLGLYGEVSVARFDGKHLPYMDNLVNLVVSEDIGDVSMSEVIRVLCPRGVAYIKREGTWRKTTKLCPDDIDEWTHFLHDASNNAVAADARVGPPRRLKWVCGPLWSRSHEFISSLCAMVSANGRLFYIFDEGLTSITTKSIPERWTLIGRDAFNGLLLWKRSMDKWGSEQWNKRALRSAPRTVPRRLTAEGNRVFVTLGYDGPVAALDAATGETLKTYEQTAGTEEMRCLRGILILRKGRNLIEAIEAESGKRLWHAGGNIQPLTLAAQHGRVFYQDGKRLMCRRLTDGKELWRMPCKSRLSLLVVHDDCVLLVGGPKLQAVSAETGERIWTADTRVPRNTLFAANEQLWHWQGERIVGRDLGTGKLTKTLDTSDVFSRGHHLRCYQSKATENFLITPYRGIEFVSVTGGPHTQNDWVRGACRYGIMPCNGLLYVPPHPCFCYPGVKLTGFNALAPVGTAEGRGQQSEVGNRRRQILQKGPAYGEFEIRNVKSEMATKPDAWPTYRHDGRRSGSTACEVTPRVCEKWRVRLRGELTPPVASGDRVYVAAKNEHTLYALHIEDGRALWRFTADGRIDSPPSVYGRAILFGCADGSVYCLRASDGELVWRFRAAPSDEQIIAFGQLESPWRVHGTILIKDGVAYFTAGRSSYLDGGISVFGLDPQTGKVLHKAQVDTWARTRKDAENKPFIPAYHIEGIQSDILVSQGDYIYVGQVKFDRKLVRQEVPYIMPDPNDKTVAMDLSGRPFVVQDAEPDQDYEKHQRDWLERTQKNLLQELRQAYGSYSLGHRKMGLHVFSTTGFLDDAWFNRTFWMYSATWPGYYIAHRGAKTGQLLVVGPEKTYAVQAYPSRNLQSPLFTPGERGYLLFADENGHEPVLDHRTRGTTKGWGLTRKQPPVWHRWLPVRIRAMVLAGGHLFVAGPPDVVDPADPYAAFEGRKGGKLRALSADDGTKLAEHDLAMPPVFDGLIATKDKLVMSTVDGQVLCFAAEK